MIVQLRSLREYKLDHRVSGKRRDSCFSLFSIYICNLFLFTRNIGSCGDDSAT